MKSWNNTINWKRYEKQTIDREIDLPYFTIAIGNLNKGHKDRFE